MGALEAPWVVVMDKTLQIFMSHVAALTVLIYLRWS